MKKTLFLMSALLLAGIGARAEEKDLTSSLQNPSFEKSDTLSLTVDETRARSDNSGAWTVSAEELSGTGWTLTNAPSVCDLMTAAATATDNNFGAPGTPSEGDYMLYMRDSWNGSATTTTLTQSVTLAAGTYKLTVDSKCIHNGATNASTAKLVANGEHAELPYHSGFVPANWDETSVTFTVDTEDTNVEIGVEIYYPQNQDGFSVLLDNFTLASVDDMELTAHYEEAEESHWSISGNTNGSFRLNTWSTELDTESGMAIPFMEYWAGAGTNLSAATIKHQQLQGLPKGDYIVSVFARAFNEAGDGATSSAAAVGDGITFTANGESVDLTKGTKGTFGYSTEVYGVYELKCTVGSEGTLDIGFTVQSETACDWLAWKDLKVVMDTDTYPDLTAPEGDMDPTVEEAMNAAIEAYNENPSGDNFFAAIEAIQDAYASIAAYAADLKGGDYLIVNQEGYYLGGGLSYGTQASIIGKPQFINFEVQADGTYHLDSHQYNNATAHYLGSDLYFDNATPVDWTIETVEGGYTIYNATMGGYLAGGSGFQTAAYISSDPYVWTLLTMDDVVASMDEASATNPVDVTALIKAPELKRNSNTTYYPTWTVTGYDGSGTPSNYSFGNNGNIASCAESYHSTKGFDFSQEITLPKAGYYTLSAKGFWRNDGSSDLSRPVLYAGDATSTFPQISRTDEYLGQDDNMVNAYQEFLLGLHQIDAIPITATGDGETITIGFKGDDTSLWHIMGELELLYYADAPAHECTAELSHWTTTGTTSIAENTWSIEGDASDLTTPFLQVWLASGNTLEAQTISHTTIEELPAGVYTVSMAIRIFSEAGNTINSGTTFNANGASEDLVSGADHHDGTYNDETEVYGTYTLTCTVGEDGKLDISIVIPDGVSYNWISFKDLKVVYVSGPIEWTLGAEYGTLILPFAYDLTADENTKDKLTAYTVESITDATDTESATLNLSSGTTSITANTPYIMGGTAGEYTFIGIPTNEADSYTSDYLTGVLEATAVPNTGSTYVLQNQDSGLAFYLVASDDITCGAYHCYLNYTAAAGAKLVVNFPDSGIATAVEAVETEEASGSGAVYDLSGRRVAKAQKGVYIVDGKKKVIK